MNMLGYGINILQRSEGVFGMRIIIKILAVIILNIALLAFVIFMVVKFVEQIRVDAIDSYVMEKKAKQDSIFAANAHATVFNPDQLKEK